MGKAEDKTVVFIGRHGEIKPLLAAVRALPEGNVVFVAATRALAEQVEHLGVGCGSLDVYLDMGRDEEIKRTATEWFDRWADKPLWDGLSYKESIALEGMGAWWFLLPVLIPDVQRCIQLTESIRALIEKENPSCMLLAGVEDLQPYPLRLGLDENLPAKVAAMVSRTHGVVVCDVRATFLRRIEWRGKCIKTRMGMAIYFSFVRRWIARYRAWLTRGKYKRADRDTKGTVALVTSSVYWRQTVDLNGEQVVDDAIAGICMSVLGERGYRLLGIDVDLSAPNRKQFNLLRQKRIRPGITWRAVEYFDRSTRIKRRRRRADIKALSYKVGEEAIRRHGMIYRGIDFAPLLADRFAYFFSYLEGAMEYLDAIDNALVSEEIDLVVIVYEEGPAGRAATVAGQRRRVPTLALQHGTLSSPYTPAYYLSAVSTAVSDDPAVCPIPTTTAVYGEHTRSMLVDIGKYPSDAVLAVGMPAHDGVMRALRGQSPASKNDLQLPPTVPMVLVVSQPFFNQENRDYFAMEVIAAAACMPRVQWAIKLHPSERSGAWQRYIERAGVDIKVYDNDLHFLLTACELVVSWYSTVILEAALFARPVISVSIPGCLAPEDYLRDGLVVGARDSTEIADQVTALLYDDGIRQRHLQQVSKALGYYIYKPDGLASERIADLGETLMLKRDVRSFRENVEGGARYDG